MKCKRKETDKIEAVQFNFSEKNIFSDYIRIVKPEIVFSRDESKFYLTGCNSTNWLTVNKIKKEDGEKYESFPFAFWSEKSGRRF